MNLRCIVIDDEPLALELMASYVEKTPFLELCGKYSSAVMALEKTDLREVELIFLDIQMPDLNGLEFSRLLPPDVRVVFTTAFEQYALEGFKANALDYLLKPVNYHEFLSAARKAQEWFSLKRRSRETSGQEDDFIYVKSGYKLIQVRLSDILYIEGLRDYLKIYLEGETHPVLTLGSMKAMEERLPSPRFMRVHRSFIVQMSKVRTMDRGQIVFGKTRIPISDTYKTDIAAYIGRYTL